MRNHTDPNDQSSVANDQRDAEDLISDRGIVNRRTLLSGIGVGIGLWTGSVSANDTGGSVSEPEPSYDQRYLFISGNEGYDTYRIPSLLTTGEGTLLAICEGRKHSSSDDGDIALIVKRSTDNGETWSDPQVLYDEVGETIGNPCPVVERSTGKIVLPFCRNNFDVLITESSDDGKTWSEPREVTGQVKDPDWRPYWYATGPGVGIQIQDGDHEGRLVVPCDHGGGPNGPGPISSHVIYSDDGGRTWDHGESLPAYTNECQVAELSNGRLVLNMRNHGDDPYRLVSYSDDGGETWSTPELDEDLPEPACQGSLFRFPKPGDESGRKWLLFSNPAHQERRVDMTVRISEDGGKTWTNDLLLHAGHSAYSSLTVLPNRDIACLYEAGMDSPYQGIRLARFDLQTLLSKDSIADEEGDENHPIPVDELDPVGDPYTVFSTVAESEFGQSDGNLVINSGATDINPFDSADEEVSTIYLGESLTEKGTVLAKIEYQEFTDDAAKAGIMVRNDIERVNESEGFVFGASTYLSGGYVMSWDDDGNGLIDSEDFDGSRAFPAWIRLEKDGSTFTMSVSTDDRSTWTQIGTHNVPGTEAVQDVGLFATTGSDARDGEKSYAMFSEFTVDNG